MAVLLVPFLAIDYSNSHFQGAWVDRIVRVHDVAQALVLVMAIGFLAWEVRARRVWRIGSLMLGYLLGFGLLMLWLEGGPRMGEFLLQRSFQQAQWLARESGGNEVQFFGCRGEGNGVRHFMARDVVRHILRPGMGIDAVQNLLGHPDWPAKETNDWNDSLAARGFSVAWWAGQKPMPGVLPGHWWGMWIGVRFAAGRLVGAELWCQEDGVWESMRP